MHSGRRADRGTHSGRRHRSASCAGHAARGRGCRPMHAAWAARSPRTRRGREWSNGRSPDGRSREADRSIPLEARGLRRLRSRIAGRLSRAKRRQPRSGPGDKQALAASVSPSTPIRRRFTGVGQPLRLFPRIFPGSHAYCSAGLVRHVYSFGLEEPRETRSHRACPVAGSGAGLMHLVNGDKRGRHAGRTGRDIHHGRSRAAAGPSQRDAAEGFRRARRPGTSRSATRPTTIRRR